MKDLTKLTDRIFYVGVNDRTKHLFEGLWPLPLGVSYNAYLVCGERTALVDTVDACFTGRLLANVRERLGDRPLDYLVINHMEPDHSASIAAVRQAYPAVRIVGNAKTLQMIEGYYGIACGTVEVREGDVLDRLVNLHIVPLAISYEYDPCDFLKAQEYQLKRDDPNWKKGPYDDIISMRTGILGLKGKIHYHVAACIDDYLNGLREQKLSKSDLLDTICTHIVDIDYNKIKMYVGNYDFWYDASQLMQNLMKNQNKKNEEKAQELKEFISRFSANKSKSKQATARRKLLEKISLEEIPASSRRYPWVAFAPDREVGKDILFVTDVSKTIDGVKVLDKVSFIVEHGDKIAFVGDNENAHTALFKILTGELEPDEGTVKWGQTATFSYFPKDNTEFFKDCDDNLVEWLRQWSSDPHEAYLRGFLGRMLFSGDEVYKPVKVLSGGEKVRCMLSRMMLSGANVLLLDQPTNHLDLESIAALNNGLEAVKCNVLFSSHDHQLVQTVANRVFDFTRDGKLIDRKMTYDEYLESTAQA